MELAHTLFLAFYELVQLGLTIGYGPLLFCINRLYVEMPLIPNFLATISSIGLSFLNKYVLAASSLFLILAYRKNFLPQRLAAAITLLMASSLRLIMPIAFISNISFKLVRSLYRFFIPSHQGWKIQRAFHHPLSDESTLCLFLAAGISMVAKSPMPFFATAGGILGGYLLIKVTNFFGNIFFGSQPISVSPSVNPLRVEPIDNNLVTRHAVSIRRDLSPPLLPPRQNHISHIPSLGNEQNRIRQQQVNFVTSLGLEQDIIIRPTISPFQKVLDLLKDPENDYLLTENNNFFLRDAAEKENWELVARLLKKTNVAAQAHYGDWLVLRLAIQHDQWKIVSKFLKLPILAQTPDSIGKNDVLARLMHKVNTQNQTSIMNQIIHSHAYNLFNELTKFKCLLLSIKHNIYSSIIKMLSDREFLDCLDFDNFNIIFENMPKDTIHKISTQCDFFLTYIKEKYTNNPITISELCVDHLINVDNLDSLENIALFYEDPFQFLRSKTKNKLHAIIAMELINCKNLYFQARDEKREAKESAQQASEVIAANQLFETVKNHYQETFDSKKTIEHSSLEAIEREIKTYLLEQILSEAHDNIKKLQNLTPSTKIINIIDTQKEALLNGDVEAHIALIKVLNKHFIPNNVSAAQTAWLSYSAIHDIDENEWKFLVQPTEEHMVYSTAESTPTDEEMTNTMASSIVRERIAYYWLAVTDETYPDPDNFRLGNFVGAISTIYKTYGFGQSCCYPGHLTGIAQMGVHHPIAEPITLDNLIDQAIIAPIIEAAKETLEAHPDWSAEDKESFLTSITFINEKNADALFHAEEAPFIDINKYQAFYNHFSCITDSIFDEIMKNKRYKNRTVSETEQEEINMGVEYKVAAMASNQYVLSALNEVILASRCIKKDINLEEASPYVPNTPKHKLYLELAKELNAKLLSLPDEKLPSIVDLNKIGGEISKKIIDGIISDNNPTNALDELKNYGISINIESIRRSHLMHAVELSVLPQFNDQRFNTRNQNATSTHTINKTTVLTKKMFS